jgi:hypothetical protein
MSNSTTSGCGVDDLAKGPAEGRLELQARRKQRKLPLLSFSVLLAGTLGGARQQLREGSGVNGFC